MNFHRVVCNQKRLLVAVSVSVSFLLTCQNSNAFQTSQTSQSHQHTKLWKGPSAVSNGNAIFQSHHPPILHNYYKDTSKSTSTTELYSKGKARFSSSPISSTGTSSTSTSILDTVLTFFSSDFGGVVLGGLGLILCLTNRLTHLDYLDVESVKVGDEIGRQARSDLLAVFATMAVFLNGVSKLDVTSALAESVVLEGVVVPSEDGCFVGTMVTEEEIREKVTWALLSVLEATPAKTAMLMQYNAKDAQWAPIAFGGIVTEDMKAVSLGNADILSNVMNVRTPIIDRFVLDESKQRLRKESYLPTLQALPGKVEFTYLPANTQEALLLPARMPEEGDGEDVAISALVLGSDTAKSFSPRDVAWCQVLAARIGGFLS